MSVRGRDYFNKYRMILYACSKALNLMPLRIRIRIFYKLRMMQGTIGLVSRYILFRSISRSCGDNVAIFPGAYVLNPQNITVGSNVSIHPMCYLEGYGGISIGDNVSIAHGVTILTTEHCWKDQSIPINNQGVISKNVIIEHNIWIGAKATILAGHSVKTGSIIGAGAVVTQNIDEYTIAAGVPARGIKRR